MIEVKIDLTFTEPILGTAPGDPEIYEEVILDRAKKAGAHPDEKEELESLPNAKEEIDQHSTVFHKDENGAPFLYDYQIKGFFKDACGMLARVKDTESSKIKAYKKVIDGLVFVFPRRISLILPPSESLSFYDRSWSPAIQRPARGQTQQGERIFLLRSETCPTNSKINFAVKLLDPKIKTLLKEWLEYGAFRGIGQWRNGSFGRFSYAIVNS